LHRLFLVGDYLSSSEGPLLHGVGLGLHVGEVLGRNGHFLEGRKARSMSHGRTQLLNFVVRAVAHHRVLALLGWNVALSGCVIVVDVWLVEMLVHVNLLGHWGWGHARCLALISLRRCLIIYFFFVVVFLIFLTVFLFLHFFSKILRLLDPIVKSFRSLLSEFRPAFLCEDNASRRKN